MGQVRPQGSNHDGKEGCREGDVRSQKQKEWFQCIRCSMYMRHVSCCPVVEAIESTEGELTTGEGEERLSEVSQSNVELELLLSTEAVNRDWLGGL
jgi:hypothetical protein